MSEPEIPVSKTRRKKAAHDLQKLGEALVELSPERLATLDLTPGLLEAVLAAQSIHARGGRKRQLQYIGRLMREEDGAAIAARLDDLRQVSANATARLHSLERWRDRLLAEPEALTEFLQAYPQVDAPQLRALLRNAHRERTQNRPPAAARAVFRLLRDTLAGADRRVPQPDDESLEDVAGPDPDGPDGVPAP